jgi:HK97 gp10 family phage protein
MAAFSMGITGLESLRKKFSNANERLEKHIAQSINQTLVNIQQDAKSQVRVKSGALQRSITHRNVDKKTLSGYVSAGNSSVRYAPFVEFGTRFQINLPPLVNISPGEQNKFARQFKVQAPKKFTNLPTRPFLMTAFDKRYSQLLYTIKEFKI